LHFGDRQTNGRTICAKPQSRYRELRLKIPLDMVKYPLCIQKLLFYTSKMSAEADYG